MQFRWGSEKSSILFHDTRHGKIAHFAADQCIGLSLSAYGEWAEDEIALLSHYIKLGSTVIDVGANVGVHSLSFAETVGSGGRVIAIEGQPSAFALLSYNIIANGLDERITAVSALAGQNTMLVNYDLMTAVESNIGAKSFMQEVAGVGSSGEGLQVKLPLFPIDSLGLTTCSLIKIDVEGMESDVILGAQRLIKSFKPLVYFEQVVQVEGYLEPSYNVLTSAGYRLFWHNSNPFNRDNYKGETANIFGGSTERNVLALPPGVADPVGLDRVTDPKLIPPLMSKDEGLVGVSIPYHGKPHRAAV